VGSLRTALYNYLFAKHHKGSFVLRIEDTDQLRQTEGAVENLLRTLEWTGLVYDEGPGKGGEFGPYYQSQRLTIYRHHVNELLKNSTAYFCFCSEERLQRMREEQIAENQTPRYDGTCRAISSPKAQARSEKEPHVVRMKIPQSGETQVKDIIRGDVIFQNEVLDDQVLLKSDGFPTYHLANVVDDHLMRISHVIRGEEWLLSTPKHVLLYNYFGWELPQFAHLPLLLNPDRTKLSKRQGDVAVEDYKDRGFLHQALLNFVALLGWNKGDDQEIFTLNELIDYFALERISKAGAIFDSEKLGWMNGIYIRNLPQEEYINLALSELHAAGLNSGDEHKNRLIVLAVRKSLTTLKDIKDKTAIFFSNKVNYYSDEALDWINKAEGQLVIKSLIVELKQIDAVTMDNFKSLIQQVQSRCDVKGKDLWMPLRSAITGLTEGPELPMVIEIIGRDKMITFLQQALKK
jgi:glutamyl-tRNA synthetase